MIQDILEVINRIGRILSFCIILVGLFPSSSYAQIEENFEVITRVLRDFKVTMSERASRFYMGESISHNLEQQLRSNYYVNNNERIIAAYDDTYWVDSPLLHTFEYGAVFTDKYIYTLARTDRWCHPQKKKQVVVFDYGFIARHCTVTWCKKHVLVESNRPPSNRHANVLAVPVYFSGLYPNEMAKLIKSIAFRINERDADKEREEKRKAAELEAKLRTGFVESYYKSHYEDAAFKAGTYRRKYGTAELSADEYNILGYMYMDGLGFQKNTEEARYYFEKAAEKGDAQGVQNLILLYVHDIKDYDAAAEWMVKRNLKKEK